MNNTEIKELPKYQSEYRILSKDSDGRRCTVEIRTRSKPSQIAHLVLLKDRDTTVPYSDRFVTPVREVQVLHPQTWSSSIRFSPEEKKRYTAEEFHNIQNCRTAKEKAEKIVRIAAQKVAEDIINKVEKPRNLKYQVQCLAEQAPLFFFDDELIFELEELFNPNSNRKISATEIAGEEIKSRVIVEFSGQQIESLISYYTEQIETLKNESQAIDVLEKAKKDPKATEFLDSINIYESHRLNSDLIYRNEQMATILKSLRPYFTLEDRFRNLNASRQRAIDEFDSAMQVYHFATQMIFHNRSLVAIYNSSVDEKNKHFEYAKSVTENKHAKTLPKDESDESLSQSRSEHTPGGSPSDTTHNSESPIDGSPVISERPFFSLPSPLDAK